MSETPTTEETTTDEPQASGETPAQAPAATPKKSRPKKSAAKRAPTDVAQAPAAAEAPAEIQIPKVDFTTTDGVNEVNLAFATVKEGKTYTTNNLAEIADLDAAYGVKRGKAKKAKS